MQALALRPVGQCREIRKIRHDYAQNRSYRSCREADISAYRSWKPKLNVFIKAGDDTTHSTDFNCLRLFPPAADYSRQGSDVSSGSNSNPCFDQRESTALPTFLELSKQNSLHRRAEDPFLSTTDQLFFTLSLYLAEH